MRKLILAVCCVGVIGTTGPSLAGGKFPSFGIDPGHLTGDAHKEMHENCQNSPMRSSFWFCKRAPFSSDLMESLGL